MKNSNSYQSLPVRSFGLLLIIVISLIIKLQIHAQKTDSLGWRLNSLSFSTGETSLTKGNTLSGSFSKNKSILVFDFNDALGEAIYFYSLSKNISAGPTIGFLNNIIWFGPISNICLFKEHVGILSWVGWSFGNTEKGNPDSEIEFCFSYHQIVLSGWKYKISYALQHYQKNCPEHIFELKKTINLNKNFSTSFGGGYMTKSEKFLWNLALNYNL